MNTKRLETARLILREYTMDDTEVVFHNWASDPLCCEYLSFDAHKNLTETRAMIKGVIATYPNSYDWVIETKDKHEIIGSITVVNTDHQMDLKNGIAEVGYCFGSKYWGHGYATEALRKIIEYLLEECGFYLVEAQYNSDNPASGRVMQKVGMKEEAVLRERRLSKHSHQRANLVIYSIKREELIKD